ncbi:MAG: hypothetical protein KDE09_17460, partial [Anaerolineales bacterium]|nr:hypothetical protein [Anaerolineales bacterium]
SRSAMTVWDIGVSSNSTARSICQNRTPKSTICQQLRGEGLANPSGRLTRRVSQPLALPTKVGETHGALPYAVFRVGQWA